MGTQNLICLLVKSAAVQGRGAGSEEILASTVILLVEICGTQFYRYFI
jgi:hypothetical protein